MLGLKIAATGIICYIVFGFLYMAAKKPPVSPENWVSVLACLTILGLAVMVVGMLIAVWGA